MVVIHNATEAAMRPGQDPRDLRSLMPWMDMATDAFETWMGFWTGQGASMAGGKASPLLEMQRQMLQAWTAPWMALGMPGLAMPEARRPEAPRPAPTYAAPPAPAARQPAPPQDLPWSTGPAAPVAVMGAEAPAAPEPQPQIAEPRPSPVRHAETKAAAPARRPRKAPKALPKLRAAPPERTHATSGRRIVKPPRKPTH